MDQLLRVVQRAGEGNLLRVEEYLAREKSAGTLRTNFAKIPEFISKETSLQLGQRPVKVWPKIRGLEVRPTIAPKSSVGFQVVAHFRSIGDKPTH
jgi:hypothetical protein